MLACGSARSFLDELLACGLGRERENPAKNTRLERVTAVPSEITLVVPSRSAANAALPRKAWVYFLAVATVTAATGLPFMAQLQDTRGWLAFLVLGSAAAVAQLFVVRTPRDQAYHTAIVFVIAGAFLLPPELVVLMGIVQHVPEWVRMRYRWYPQTFNICIFVLASMAVWFVAERLLGSTDVHSASLRFAAAGLVACAVFVAINHILLAVMLHLARGHSLRETGLFEIESLATDAVLAALGVVTYAFWKTNPWLIPFAVAPLVLVHRSLAVPQLQAEARIDPKTGLFNARHFATALAEEIGRADRFDRPLSLIMADLDLLRDINNRYGHLAGDAVLKGIANVFRAELRDYDVPARFGGEEFSILLPETPPERAVEIAERIRRAVAERGFAVDASKKPLRATVSIGVAAFPRDATDATELVHEADLAVYRAKLQGRNRVVAAGSKRRRAASGRSSRLGAVPESGGCQPRLAVAAEATAQVDRA
jgi:diguanylate cyclase (GGDEF)-like protein